MAALTKGTVLEDTYEIMEEIGAGGGGVVFRARHLRLQTDVVVKKIKDEVRGKVKSRREADILKKLKHPYLPRVYDFIETDDAVYTVMDFIHGEDLETAVKHHGKYPQKQVRKWAQQLGEALDYLHSQNPPIIHSDIKPANIMLTEEENICLIDFNISLAMGGEMESAVGISAGFSPPEQYRDPAAYARITHNYTWQKPVRATKEEQSDKTELPGAKEEQEDKTELLEAGNDSDKANLFATNFEVEQTELLKQSNDKTEILQPEMINGNAASGPPQYTQYIGKGIDARSDIYSLGVTLWFLLTGTLPPVDFGQRIPIGQTNAAVSEGFAVIIDKMMELSPDKRYQNGREYLKAIQNCYKLDHRYIVMHRKQTAIQLAAVVCLALGILVTFDGIYKIRMEKNAAYYELVQNAEYSMEQYDYEEADSLLEQARQSDAARIEAYEREVYLLYLSEKYEECIDLGMEYINTAPFELISQSDRELYGNIFYIVGNAYFETDDFSNAERCLASALEYNKSNGFYYRDYAVTLAKMGRTEEAQEQLDTGIGLGLAQDSIYMAQGEIAHVKGQYGEALEYLQQTIAGTSDMQMKKRAVLLCVDVYKTIGNEAVDREIELLEQYRSQFEGSGSLVMTEYLAEAYTRKAQTDEAKASECYQAALDLFRTIYDSGYVTYQLQQNMAILYENLGRFDEAEALLQQMAEAYPERYEVYKRLAYLEADKQQTKENMERDYRQMLTYYEKAKEKYSGEDQDMEMDMLDKMMQELKDGGWL